jgi:hypothetical protein
MRNAIKIMVVLSSVLFATAFSCSKKQTIGEPYILYEVHGTVYGSYYKDVEGGGKEYVTTPLKGIKVISDSSSEAAYTSAKGTFVVYGRSVPSETVTIAFEDEDVENNHGLFLRTTKRVTLRKQKEGGDRNYEGYWIATGVEVTMLKKDDSLDTDPDPDDL